MNGICERGALRERIAHNLTYLMRINDVKASELAYWIGVNPSMVSAWKAGRKAMSLSRAMDVSVALRVTVDELCGRKV